MRREADRDLPRDMDRRLPVRVGIERVQSIGRRNTWPFWLRCRHCQGDLQRDQCIFPCHMHSSAIDAVLIRQVGKAARIPAYLVGHTRPCPGVDRRHLLHAR